MTEPRSVEEAARLLRQRLEMGGGEIFLDGLTREEALRLVASARVAASAPDATSAGPTAERGGPTATGGASTDRGAPEKGATEKSAGQGLKGAGSTPRAAAATPGASAAAAAPAGDAEAVADFSLPDDYDALREMALSCTRCALSKGRTQVVFSDGPRDARLMVVGEAPGANEDETGVPFVGAAGQYLDLLLATVGLSRKDSVYIANVLKCRPPGNRDPKPDEIETCSPYLRKQIDLVGPKALLAVGSFSGKLLTGREKVSLGKLRGEVHSYHGVPLVVTYHPAALLRNPRWVRPFWDDLQLLRGVMARGDGAS